MALLETVFEVLFRNLLKGKDTAGEPWNFRGETIDK
jgi:hypothetical protein